MQAHQTAGELFLEIKQSRNSNRSRYELGPARHGVAVAGGFAGAREPFVVDAVVATGAVGCVVAGVGDAAVAGAGSAGGTGVGSLAGEWDAAAGWGVLQG
jgi:hypothetical protein